MFGLQGLGIQSFLDNIFPGDKVVPGGAGFVAAQHLLQEVFGLLFPLGQKFDLLAGLVVLVNQVFGLVRKFDSGVRHAVREPFGQEPGRSVGAVQGRRGLALDVLPDVLGAFVGRRLIFSKV